ncbi:prepilin peptidase [Martelella alba]|uniref:Prepilin peptidase n=1 Tax=Martelella alba TaxID=2590451 RepID=A0ABY2SF87_9HYPH|nr:A24 family peptidase [Martelella alba]TKI03277.1 prepilin peptidase [Martelella alba]
MTFSVIEALLNACFMLYGLLMGHLSRRILAAMPVESAVSGPQPLFRSPAGGIRTVPRVYDCEISCALLFLPIPSFIDGLPPCQWPAALLLGWFLSTLSWIDYHLLLLPDKLTGPCLLCGLAFRLPDGVPAVTEGMIGAAAGGAVMALLNAGFLRWRGYRGMGGGDGKLLAALGAWLGWRPLSLVCCEAALFGLAVYALAGRTHGKIPFGPCLALAGWLEYISS